MASMPLRDSAVISTDVSARKPNRVSKLLASLLTLPIMVYRTWISPMTGPTCRFYPSCSQYAVTALSVHGAGKGSLLAVARICRCHPWTSGGVDAVPLVGSWRATPYVRDESAATVRTDISSTTPVIDVRSAE
ncbi:MAG: membrane protein insertion efficiency factor YidD [Actinomycetes bacterium]